MAEFVQTMRDWRRMCNEMQLMNGCEDCPIIKNTHRGEVHCVGGETPADVVGISKIAQIVTDWAAEHPEPVYPSVAKYLEQFGIIIRRDGSLEADFFKAHEPMSADLAGKLGMKPKEG